LRQREGVKTNVYKDSEGRLTVGISHLVTSADKLKLRDEITDQQVSEFFKNDSAKALAADTHTVLCRPPLFRHAGLRSAGAAVEDCCVASGAQLLHFLA
jgi:GH24 family phage-related lysozyme (muramidase)